MNTFRYSCLFLSLVLLVFIAACSPLPGRPTDILKPSSIPESTSTSPPTEEVVPTATLSESPETSTPSPAFTFTPSPEPTQILPSSTPPVQIEPGAGPLYELLFTIPANTGTGIRYRNVGVAETVPDGPNTFTILDDGSFVIHDIINEGLVHYSGTGEFVKGVKMRNFLTAPTAFDLASANQQLYVLQEHFGPMPEINWLHILSPELELIESIQLPAQVSMQSGLTGMVAGPDGAILAELEGGMRLVEILDSSGEQSGIQVPGFIQNGKEYWAVGSEGAAGDIRFGTTFTEGQGGMRILSVLPDGSFYVIRTDVMMVDDTIKVDETIHLLNSLGETLGAARFPVAEWLYPPTRYMTMGPDHQIYGMLPLRNGLALIRLKFYTALEPFIPGASNPEILPLQ